MFWLNRDHNKYTKTTMLRGTGKAFPEWVIVLNTANQRKQTHTQVMDYLMQEHHLTPSWARTIAVYYHMRDGATV